MLTGLITKQWILHDYRKNANDFCKSWPDSRRGLEPYDTIWCQPTESQALTLKGRNRIGTWNARTLQESRVARVASEMWQYNISASRIKQNRLHLQLESGYST